MIEFKPTENYDQTFASGDKHREKSRKQKPTPRSEQFVPVSFNRIDDPIWRKKHRAPLTGYIYIRSQIVRQTYNGDTYDLYNRYFRDNKFAAATSYRHLAEAFGYVGDNTKPVRGWVKKLYAEGAFIIDKIDVPGKPEPANVYVLGHNEQGKHVYYYDI